MSKQPSIRDHLESEARRKYPRLAHRLSRGTPAPPHGWQTRHPRRALRWEDRGLLILTSVLLLLLIVRVETARADDGEFWGVEFAGNGGTRQAVALNTEIRANVSGLVARIEVTQVFRNDGPNWAEATYRYPLPTGAAVDRMRIEVGQRVLEGEIREKLEARRQYQQAAASGKVASLVEQDRANTFKTKLANISAGEEIRVSIGFLAHIDFSGGEYSLQIPMTFTPRWSPPSQEGNGLQTFVTSEQSEDHYLTLEIDLETGFNLASLESRFHDVNIHPTLNGFHVFLADPDTRTDRVFELAWTPEFGDVPETTLMTYDDGNAVYALLMLAPPLIEAIDPQPREVVFIIDTSGSMEGTPIEQARAALLQGLTFLGPDDRFNLVEFNSDAQLLFGESVPTEAGYLDRATETIEDLEANGGTVMAPALDLAMNLPPQDGLLRQIVFITDGSVGNEQELLLQVGEQLHASRLFTVSIGSAPNAWFMRKAAEIGRGSHTHIGRLEQVEERMSALWARIENPALQDICIDWGMQAEFYPEIVPDLYAGEPLWLHARLPAEPRDVLVCGEIDGQYWERSARLLPGAGGESIATLWARSRVESLEDSRIFGVDADHVRSAVLETALAYDLLTAYTSLVAVDKTPVRMQDESMDRSDVGNLLPAGSTLSAGFSQTATGWPLRLGLSLLSLLVASGMLLYLPPSRSSHRRGDGQPAASTPR